jgi:hypothetical protein
MPRLFFSPPSSSRSALLCSAAALALLMGWATAARAPLKTETSRAEVRPDAPSQAERLAAEVIRLTPNGFEPSEITRPKGRFLIHVENRTILTEISLSLSREAGGREHGARLLKRRKWVEMVNIPPGRYLLTEESHPEWSCRITITPQ